MVSLGTCKLSVKASNLIALRIIKGLLIRFKSCDWGDVDEITHLLNENSRYEKGMIFGRYKVKGINLSYYYISIKTNHDHTETLIDLL